MMWTTVATHRGEVFLYAYSALFYSAFAYVELFFQVHTCPCKDCVYLQKSSQDANFVLRECVTSQ